ncbi:MAG: translocation/assembly module TamB domain-containing protein [Prevotella sp.]|nr:translocation/assembly module TamB domain-containing protein [Prevotella sp.]
MKKALWWILGILLSPVLLFALLTVLLYLPPVQNWVVDKVASVVSEKTGMQITIDHVNLEFPLDLGIDGFRVAQPDSSVMPPRMDTIADVRRLVADVQLLPLLQKRVVINELEVSDARINTLSLVEAARVQGQLGRLYLTSRGIDLDRQTVEVNGAQLEDAHFDIALSDSVPEDTTTTKTLWLINADSISILRSDVTLHLPGDTMSVQARMGRVVAREAVVDLGREEYTVGSFDWTDGRLTYDQNFEPRVDGLDFNHIDLSDIHIGLDSIYYHSPDARLNIRYARLREQSGLQVSDLSGPVAMVNNSISLPRFRLRTPDSDIEMELNMPLSLMEKVDPGKMRLRLNAQLGKQDLMRFLGDMPQQFQQRWPNQPLTVRGMVNGNMDYVDFTGLDIALPSAFKATASGFAANVTDMKRLRAKVQFKAQTQNLDFVTSLLPRQMQRDYRIPRGITAEGTVSADGPLYAGNVTAREGGGVVKAKGSFNSAAMSYNVDADIRQLNIHHFMPHDSIYTVTAQLKAKGRGVDFLSPRTTLQADATISHLGYGHWNLDHITANAQVRDGKAQATLVSDNPLLRGTINAAALVDTRKLDATVSTDISSADLMQLRVMETPLTIGLCGHFDITSDLNQAHRVEGYINDLTVTDGEKEYRPTDVTLNLLTNRDTTWADVSSGNLALKMKAGGGYEQLLQQFTALADELTGQLDRKVIDQPRLRELLPRVQMRLTSGSDNPIAGILATQGLSFKDLFFDLATSPEQGVNGSGYLHSLVYDGTRLDTITFNLKQRGDQLSFNGQIQNNKRNPQFVFNALFDGVLQERGATLGVRYYDADNRLGARVGAQAEMVDSGISIHLVPARPTLGYKEFAVNSDNYIFFGASGRVQANVDLVADDQTSVKLYSEDQDPANLQDLTLSLHQFNLDEITSVMPYVPRMSGLMNGDYHIIQDETKRFSVVSAMSVDDMTYEHSPIGNVSTEFVYLQKEDDAHALEARLMRDDVEIGMLSGIYYNSGEGSLDAKLELERLPLQIVNGFIPDQLFGFEGYAEGTLDVKGPLSRPQVNGVVQLDSSYLVSIPYGMNLRVGNTPVRIVGSTMQLDNFSIYAHNNNPLTLTGNIDFSNLDRMTVDLRMVAQNYQVISAKENSKSVAYGKAFINFFGSMTGPVENLQMRGKLDVLGTTDMSYILRDSPLTTDNQLDELVRFTDFSDTTQTVVNRPPLTGFNMDLTMEVSKGAHIMAYLNTDHSNYIDLMGGGTLRMQYTPADNLRLTGRYTLSNGEMKYSLPVIPLKTFTIQDGSYIEFTGEPMNPTLNITATEQTKATVSNSSGVGRSVTFDCGVIITKTLNDMGLEFTLDAPQDMELHSELQSMSVEQRGKLAVSMLTTGMYLADGNTNAFSMNSALSSFLSSEINNITGNALRTLDLSFGLDNTTDATGASHTDYSFKFAKRLWNNRLRIVVGGKVSTGSEIQNQNNSFFDNVTLEYRLDDTANKYVTLFYQNNAYDWLDGYTQEFGAGFIWRRTLQNFSDIFRFKADTPLMPTLKRDTLRVPSDTIQVNEK